ncbi:LAFA_0D15214g1_1 [Lachancea sp. 'fantastica']|nr:LAFA_0D15214g1_1 [Lachancea sp. 'fantastica']
MRLPGLRALSLLGALIPLSTQETVPAVLSSHQLTPGLLKYQQDYDNANVLPQDLFFDIAQRFISKTRSDAYLFINIPGLRATDLIEHQEQLGSFVKYLETSSTALRFENVEMGPDWEEIFDNLVSYTEEEWDITDSIELWKNHTETFERYIDWRPRVIRVEFDQVSSESRAEYFGYCDRTIRHLLGQIPSSDTKIILTSRTGSGGENEASVRIFPHIFEDSTKKTDFEKNKHSVMKTHELNTPQPKFTGMADIRLSIVDADFLSQHGTTIKLIIFSSLTYTIFQLALWNRTKRPSQPKKKVVEQKKNQ